MITVIDFEMGNIGSIVNMLKYLGVPVTVASTRDEVALAQKIILPGVGNFAKAMQSIRDKNLYETLNSKVVDENTPILGICLGMQLMTRGSEEGDSAGFGWIDAVTHRFKLPSEYKIPHVGWNTIRVSNSNQLVENMKIDERFYFVHSYCVRVCNEENSMLKTNYGDVFDSGIYRGNIYGVQFHPEKSHRYGKALFQQFARI